MKTAILIVIIIAIGLMIMGQYQELKSQTERKRMLDDLKTFSYFVGNCTVNTKNKETISSRLKEYNNLDECRFGEFSDLLWKINQLYIKRFLL